MPLLYETVMQTKRFSTVRLSPQITRKTYAIPFPSTLPEGSTVGKGTITWDPKYTKVVVAYLRVAGDLVVGGGTIITPVRGRVSFIVNGAVDGEVLGDICIGECHKGFSFDYDITYIVQNGENTVSCEVAKSWGWPTWVQVRNFSCAIVIDFEGTPPEVNIKPPPPEWWGYVKWGAIGVGAIAGAFIVLKAIEVTRKPKG
jgi:hypothetical protein